MSDGLRIIGIGFFVIEFIALVIFLLISIFPAWNEEVVKVIVLGMLVISLNIIAGLMVLNSN